MEKGGSDEENEESAIEEKEEEEEEEEVEEEEEGSLNSELDESDDNELETESDMDKQDVEESWYYQFYHRNQISIFENDDTRVYQCLGHLPSLKASSLNHQA